MEIECYREFRSSMADPFHSNFSLKEQNKTSYRLIMIIFKFSNQKSKNNDQSSMSVRRSPRLITFLRRGAKEK